MHHSVRTPLLCRRSRALNLTRPSLHFAAAIFLAPSSVRSSTSTDRTFAQTKEWLFGVVSRHGDYMVCVCLYCVCVCCVCGWVVGSSRDPLHAPRARVFSEQTFLRHVCSKHIPYPFFGTAVGSPLSPAPLVCTSALSRLRCRDSAVSAHTLGGARTQNLMFMRRNSRQAVEWRFYIDLYML